MPAPLDPTKRDAIIDAIRSGGHRNDIAREHQVSGSTVSKIAKDEGLADAFDRSALKRATEARSTDLAARRSELAALLMDDAFELRRRMWESQYQVVVVPVKGGGASTETVAVPTSAGDFRNYLTAIGIAIDKVGVLTRDETEGLAAVDSWLRSLGVGAPGG